MGVSRSRLTRLIQRDPPLWREYVCAAGSKRENEQQHTKGNES